MSPRREVWALEGGLDPGWRSESRARPQELGMMVWTIVDLWTQIKDCILRLRSGSLNGLLGTDMKIWGSDVVLNL